MSANPLLEKSALPNQAPPFDRIKTEHYLPGLKAGIEEARANIEKIKKNKAEPDFENTLVALETASETIDQVTAAFYNQLSATGGDELHALAAEMGPLGAKFSNDVILDAKLFKRVDAVYEKRESLNLTPEQKTLLEETWKGFVRGGAKLSKKKKERLREISERLSTLTPAFMQNTVKATEAFELVIDDEKDLSGLPDSAIESAAHAAEEKGCAGKWLFTLDYPSFGPFLQYADNRELREKIWRANASKAWKDQYDNSAIILEIVSLKRERAKLLGYKTHAHYVLEERMAKSPDEVLAFLKKLKKVYKPAAKKDLAKLKKYAAKEHGLNELMPWDVGYYSEKLRKKLFDFTSEDFRPYYSLEKVLTGCFDHFSKLFGIKFVKTEGKYPVWHKDVQVFDVVNSGDGAFVGTFFADFHPRTGKSQGAWMTTYRNQGLWRGKVERPVVAIVCNFTKPTKDKPSLLTHGEVTTLYHEMGHAIHGLLSNVTYRALAGTNVRWDFVELPSQLQENWCYEKSVLDTFATHYQTGEKIPAKLVEKLNKAQNYMVGWGGLRQMSLAQLDMAWHTKNPEKITDVAEFEDAAIKDCALFPRLAGPISTSFGHIFAGGYSAGYYSYKWAEVLDADTFELFKEKGLYDTASAQAYRKLLASGGSEDPAVLYRNFRGRDADPDALLRREGLLKAEKKKAA